MHAIVDAWPIWVLPANFDGGLGLILLIVDVKGDTYHKTGDDHCEQKEGHTDHAFDVHAVPHRLNPFAT